jgi:hypothetical protein
MPLKVHAPAFITKSIAQSTTWPGALNTITVTLRANIQLTASSNIYLAGFVGGSSTTGRTRETSGEGSGTTSRTRVASGFNNRGSGAITGRRWTSYYGNFAIITIITIITITTIITIITITTIITIIAII